MCRQRAFGGRLLAGLVGLLLLAGTTGCDKDRGSGGPAGARHGLVSAIEGVRASIRGLSDDEVEELDNFLRFTELRASLIELKKACELTGRGLRDADPELIVRFILSATDSLYDDFFRVLPPARLSEVVSALSRVPEVSEVQRLRLTWVMQHQGGLYQGTLGSALSGITLEAALSPSTHSVDQVLPGKLPEPEEVIGAAELLRLPALLDCGARPDLAVELLRAALKEWPEDARVLASLVSLYTADEGRYGKELVSLLEEGERRESDNAAWPYLRAMRAFQTGDDETGLACLRAATERTRVTFHTFRRASCAISRLRKLGYGPLRARICALRVLSEAPWFDLKLLANSALKRSREYVDMRPPEDLDIVLHFPHVLDRQLEGVPQPAIAQKLRATILQRGLLRLIEYYDRREPDRKRVQAMKQRLGDVRTWLGDVEKGEKVTGGHDRWEKLYTLLGEERFLRYVTGVVYGNESEFLSACSGGESLQDCLDLTQTEYRF